ncbi:MAG: sugar phosphate isomerase/epimerase family protein [Spirochaetales bacterium]
MANTIGIQQYSLKNYPGGWQPAFEAAREMGFEVIEPWCGAVPNDPDAATSVAELRRTLERTGLSLACGHMTVAEFDTRYDEWSSFLLDNGSKHWVVPFARGESLDEWLELIPKFREMHARLAKDGLALAYHNHHMELDEYEGKRVFEHLLDEMPELQAQFHIGQFLPSRGIALPDWVRKYEGRVCSLHVNDATEDGAARLGEGSCRAVDSIKTALDTGVTTFIIEVDLTPESAEGVKRDLETLQSLVG